MKVKRFLRELGVTGTLSLVALLVIVFTCAIVLGDVGTYKIKETASESSEVPNNEEVDTYRVGDVTEELVGESVMVIGYMCNEIGEDVSVAWLTDKPFRSKEDVQYEVRIESSSLINYTPMVVAVYGKIEEIPASNRDGDELACKINASDIYIYSGEIEEYAKFNTIISEGIFDAFMTVFAAGELNEDNKSEFESALELCELLEETELLTIGNGMMADGCDMEELYNQFRSQMLNR